MIDILFEEVQAFLDRFLVHVVGLLFLVCGTREEENQSSNIIYNQKSVHNLPFHVRKVNHEIHGFVQSHQRFGTQKMKNKEQERKAVSR